MNTRGLAGKLLLPTLGLVAVGLGLIGLIGFHAASTAVGKYTTAALAVAAGSLSRSADLWVEARRMELAALTEYDGTEKALGDGFLAIGARKAMTERLQRLQQSTGAYRTLMLVRSDGTIVAQSNPDEAADASTLLPARERLDFQSGTPVVRHGYAGPGGGAESLLALPILKEGQSGGLLIGVLAWSSFGKDYLAQARVSQQGRVQVFNPEGQLMLSLDGAEPFRSALQDLGLQELFADGAPGHGLHTQDGRQWLSSGVTAPQTGFRVVVSADQQEIEAEARQGARWSGLTGLIVLGLVALALALIVNHVLRPARAAVHALREFAQGQGDLTRRLRVNTRDEVGELARYFNQFVATLEGLVGQVKQASRDVGGSTMGLEQVVTSSRGMVEQLKAETLQIASAVNELSSASSSVAQTAAGHAQGVWR